MRENVYPEQIDRFLESWVALAQQSSSTGNYRVEREGSNRRFVPGDKKNIVEEDGTFVLDDEQFVRGSVEGVRY